MIMLQILIIYFMMKMMTKNIAYEVECRYEIITRNGREMTKWFPIFGTRTLNKEIAKEKMEEIKSTLIPKMGKHEYRIVETE